MHDRKHLCHLGKARGRIELSMIVTYFQCLTLRVRSGHLSNALTRERSWLTEKLVSPPYQSQSVVDSFTNYKKKKTLQWPHFGPTVQPLGDPWTKWSQRTGLDISSFLLFVLLFSFFFGLKLRGTRHLATRLQSTLQWPHFGPTVQPLGDPWAKWSQRTWFRQFYFIFGLKLRGTRHLAIWLHKTLQWPHFGPTVQPLGDPWAKWSQRTDLDNFFLFCYFRTQVARNKTSGYHGHKKKKTLQWSHFEPTVQRLGRPLDKLRPKDWFRYLSTSTWEEREKRL